MARLFSPPGAVLAFLLQVTVLSTVANAKDRVVRFLARQRLEQSLPPVQFPFQRIAPVYFHRQPASPAPAPLLAVAASPVVAASPAAMPLVMDCSPVCEEAKKMWKEADEAQKLAIELDKNQTAARIGAEADKLVEQVKLSVMEQGEKDVASLQGNVDNYLVGRVKSFRDAVTGRHNQVVAAKAQQFEALKQHQSKLMEGLLADVIGHGYEVAKFAVDQEAQRAGANFAVNPTVHAALESVEAAGAKWASTYHSTELSARQGFDAWSGAYHGLNDPWNNVTASLNKANLAAEAARGLGPDTRWASEVVRVSGDVTQAAQTESKRQATQADTGFHMAETAAEKVAGNSGNILKIKDLLDQAEKQAEAAVAGAK